MLLHILYRMLPLSIVKELLYKVTYKNTTGKDQKVEIKDKIPEYTTYVDGSASDGGVYRH